MHAINDILTGEHSEFGDTPLGTFRDFLCGFCVGLGLGFVMLLCVWDRHVSHRQVRSVHISSNISLLSFTI